MTLLVAHTLPAFAESNGHAPPIVIAHRGASGYLPEHTLEAKTLAYAMKVDYIEQDLVMSKDNHLIVMHDIHLDGVTDVADRYPNRAREDGHYYTIDFTLPELKQLQVTGPFALSQGKRIPKYGRRFPLWKSRFQLATFDEELELIQGLNASLGYGIGIYPEIKKPYFHQREGRDISKAVLETLKKYGFTSSRQKVFLQCFDAEELQRIRHKLMPDLEMDLPLVQLIAETDWGEKQVIDDGRLKNYDYAWMRTDSGLQKIASYAQGIGPWFPMLIDNTTERFTANGLTSTAQSLGLLVHPYTFRADPEQISEVAGDFDKLLAVFLEDIGVDGIFTDHPDKAITFITTHKRPNKIQASRELPVR
ncbi:glycerophosphodiester phosphodiesterase [Microbulbifer bruguierae]|uniref:glycerophosphodiester phosphodiesterase n=1 Tax=Microbulbifer bruguierae TaxID=3029061 RepID=A0ABY8NGU9_9GAMM|nr:glycerophosphodiester phosphodiesterase [Microbulbifer bruguierae]WGL18143.1 glycerophosphodiester phosphodiesterase [Microbulbifer bruguierae]